MNAVVYQNFQHAFLKEDPFRALSCPVIPESLSAGRMHGAMRFMLQRVATNANYIYSGFHAEGPKPLNTLLAELKKLDLSHCASPILYSQAPAFPRVLLIPEEYKQYVPQEYCTHFLVFFLCSSCDQHWRKELFGLVGLSTIHALYDKTLDEKASFLNRERPAADIFDSLLDEVLTKNGMHASRLNNVEAAETDREALRLMLCTACTTPLVSPDEILCAMEERLNRNPHAYTLGSSITLPATLLNVAFLRNLDSPHPNGLSLLMLHAISDMMRDTWNVRLKNVNGEIPAPDNEENTFRNNLERIIALDTVLNACGSPMSWKKALKNQDARPDWESGDE